MIWLLTKVMRQTFQLATSILKITWVSVFLPRSGYYCSNSIIIWEHYSVNGDVFDIQNNYFFALFFPFFFVEIFFCREKNFTSLMDQRRSCKRISLLFIHKSHWMGNCWKMRRTNTKKIKFGQKRPPESWSSFIILARSAIVLDFRCTTYAYFAQNEGKKMCKLIVADWAARRKAQSK